MQLEGKITRFKENFLHSSEGTLDLEFFGTNCAYISDGTTNLMIDPHFTRPAGVAGPGFFYKKISPNKELIEKHLKRAGINKLDAILLTHTHYDHALDLAETSKLTGAEIYGTRTSQAIAEGGGVNSNTVHLINADNKFRVGVFEVEFIKSRHMPFPKPIQKFIKLDTTLENPLIPPAKPSKYLEGGSYDILLTHKDKKILSVGTPGIIEDALKNYHADIVLLGVGGIGLLGKEYVEKVFEEKVIKTGAKKILLTHWDDFCKPLDGPTKGLININKAISLILEKQSTDYDISILPIEERLKI